MQPDITDVLASNFSFSTAPYSFILHPSYLQKCGESTKVTHWEEFLPAWHPDLTGELGWYICYNGNRRKYRTKGWTSLWWPNIGGISFLWPIVIVIFLISLRKKNGYKFIGRLGFILNLKQPIFYLFIIFFLNVYIYWWRLPKSYEAHRGVYVI
jgi:hypothetical protein